MKYSYIGVLTQPARGAFAGRFVCLAAFFLLCAPISLRAESVDSQRKHLANSPLSIDTVWGSTAVAYDAISVGPIVYVTYYDSQRRLTVARADTASRSVAKKTFDSQFEGWDAHNNVTLAYDKRGHLHVAGNMHTAPLIYGRTLRPGDFGSLTQTNRMVGKDEMSVTHPQFFVFLNGDLGFTYRSGRSGNGVELINRFDGDRWTRVLSHPLFGPARNGEPVNAYHTGYIVGPDKQFHVAWVWRKAPAAEANFNVNYARSLDLENWVTSQGKPLTLPLTPANAEVVDTIPAGGGLPNNIKLGFDSAGAPVISYLKYEGGNSQLYHGRPEGRGWQIAQATEWQYRWTFSGPGTIIGEISFTGVRVEQGKLIEDINHKKYGRLRLTLDPKTLEGGTVPTSQASAAGSENTKTRAPFRLNIRPVRPAKPGSISGTIQWQSLGVDNNDRPRTCASSGLPEGCSMTSTLELLIR